MTGQNSTPKIILVTGGSRGLGRNTAISAARTGFDVIITYHTNRDAAAEVVNEIEGLGRKAVVLRASWYTKRATSARCGTVTRGVLRLC